MALCIFLYHVFVLEQLWTIPKNIIAEIQAQKLRKKQFCRQRTRVRVQRCQNDQVYSRTSLLTKVGNWRDFPGYEGGRYPRHHRQNGAENHETQLHTHGGGRERCWAWSELCRVISTYHNVIDITCTLSTAHNQVAPPPPPVTHCTSLMLKLYPVSFPDPVMR